MKQYTQKELEDIVNKVMKADPKYSWTQFNIKIIKQTEKELLFEATHMYDWETYTPNLKQLMEFSKFFGTINVDKYDDISYGGCETCDYGSSYGFALRVWDNA